MEQMTIFDFLEQPKTSSEPTALIVGPDEIKITSVEAYSYIRECDNRKMTAFICECENGMLYKKDFYTYHHMVKNSKKNKTLFYKEIDKNRNMPFFKAENGYMPEIIEMHRCRETVDWDYADSNYSGCEDSTAYNYQSV